MVTALKKEHSPFIAFTKSLATEKKKPFMDLMKRLRAAKNASVGTKEEKKKATMSLDADIHKLLGPEYKRYRSVQHAQKELHAAKKGSTGSSKSVTGAVAPPSPGMAPAARKKAAAKLPGTAPKKPVKTIG